MSRICHTYEWVMAHNMNESWVMAHNMNESRESWVMSHESSHQTSATGCCASACQKFSKVSTIEWRRLIGSPKVQIIFHKRATKSGHFCQKWPIKIRGPMSLRHPVSWSSVVNLVARWRLKISENSVTESREFLLPNPKNFCCKNFDSFESPFSKTDL